MRVIIPKETFEANEIEIKDRVFQVDERESTFEKIQDCFKNIKKNTISGESIKKFYALALGEEAAEWIKECDFSMRVHTEIMCSLFAIYTNKTVEEIRDAFFREQSKA